MSDRTWRTLPMAARIALAFVALVAVAALLAPWLSGDPIAIRDPVGAQLLPPGTDHLLGTDAFSRDVWARLLHGARVSLLVGVGATVLATAIGALVGFAAGLGTPLLDGFLMRAVDVLLALPRLFILIAALALWDGAPLGIVITLIAVTGWMDTSRLVRAHVRELRSADFIAAARALGGGWLRVARHLLPHVGTTLVVSATMDVGGIMLLEAGLSFLGLGLQLPAPSWGNMIMEGRNLMFRAPWVALAPGLALTLTAIAFNLIGDGLRDLLDPRVRPA